MPCASGNQDPHTRTTLSPTRPPAGCPTYHGEAEGGDYDVAHEVTLRDLLQCKGYDDLDVVIEEGRRAGRVGGLRTAVRDAWELLGVAPSSEREAAIDAMNEAELSALRDRLKRDRRWP